MLIVTNNWNSEKVSVLVYRRPFRLGVNAPPGLEIKGGGKTSTRYKVSSMQKKYEEVDIHFQVSVLL